MATLTQTYETGRSAAPNLTGITAGVRAAYAAWTKRRRLQRELDAHTDRELADMGFTRDDIAAVARGSFRR